VPFIGGTGSAACPATGAATSSPPAPAPGPASATATPSSPPAAPAAPGQAQAKDGKAGSLREAIKDKIEERVDCKLHTLKCLHDMKGEQGKSG
jgi:hypothetical protein